MNTISLTWAHKTQKAKISGICRMLGRHENACRILGRNMRGSMDNINMDLEVLSYMMN
jgi:hypothetical protein